MSWVEIYVYILYIYVYIYISISNVQYVLWFMILVSFFLPCLWSSQNLFVPLFPHLETLAPRTKTRWQVLSTLDMKNMKRDPGIIVGFLAHGFDGGNLEVQWIWGFFIVSLVWNLVLPTREFEEFLMERGTTHHSSRGPWMKVVPHQRQQKTQGPQGNQWKPMDRACW